MDESSDGLPPDCKLIASLLRSCASLVSKQAPKQGESRYLRSILAVVAEAEKQESSALDGGRDDDNGPTFALIDGLAAARRARREDAALSCSSLVIDGSSEVKSAADIGALPQGAGEDGAAATSVQSMHEEPNMPSASEKVSEGSDKLSSLASKRTSQGPRRDSKDVDIRVALGIGKWLAHNRASYFIGDLVHLLNGVLGDEYNERTKETLALFNQDVHKALDFKAFSNLVNRLVGHSLKRAELTSLYNAIDNSHDEITLATFLNFFRLSRQSNTRVVVQPARNSINAVDVSHDQRFLAFGNNDCHARVYDMHTGGLFFVRQFDQPVTGIALSPTGGRLAVGCLEGELLWIALDQEGAVVFRWQITRGINALAVNPSGTEIAAAGDAGKVHVFSLDTGLKKYVFDAYAPVHTISLANSHLHTLELVTGEEYCGLVNVEKDELGVIFLTGKIVHAHEDARPTLSTRVCDWLMSPRSTKLVLLLSLTGTTIAVLTAAGPLKSSVFTTTCQTLLMLIFIGEILLRLAVCFYLRTDIGSFMRNVVCKPFCVADLLSIVLELVCLTMMPNTFGGQGLFFAVRVIPRITRNSGGIASFRGPGTPEERADIFDVSLDSGDVLPHVSRSMITALETKPLVNLESSSQQSKGSKRNNLQRTMRTMSHQVLRKSPAMQKVIENRPHRRRSVVVPTARPTGETSTTDSRATDERLASSSCSSVKHHLQVGTPVEVRLPGTKMTEMTDYKLVSFNGAGHQVLAYRYDISSRPDADKFPDMQEEEDEDEDQARTQSEIDGASSRRSSRRQSAWASRNSTRSSRRQTYSGAAPLMKSQTIQDFNLEPITCISDPEMSATCVFSSTKLHPVKTVSLSGDTRRLACGDEKGNLTVHAIGRQQSGEAIFEWQSERQINGASLSYSGQYLASGGAFKKVRVFDVDAGAEVYRRSTKDRVRAVKLSLDGQTCVSGCNDGSLHACDIQAGARLRLLQQSTSVYSCAIDSAGITLAIGCEGTCECFDLSVEAKEPKWVANHNGKVKIVAVSSDGKFVAAGDYANTARVYLSANKQVVYEKTTWDGKSDCPSFVWGLDFSAKGSLLAIGHWYGYCYILSTRNFSELARIRHDSRVYSVCFDKKGEYIAIGGRSRNVVVWALAGGESTGIDGSLQHSGLRVMRSCSISAGVMLYTIALSPDSQWLAVGTVNNEVLLYDVSGSTVGTLEHRLPYEGVVQSVSFSCDGRFLGIGGEENTVVVVELHGAAPPSPFIVLPRTSTVQSVAFSENSLVFAAGTLATVYGGASDYHFTDRPSHEVISDIVSDNGESGRNLLQILTTRHPHVVHTASPLLNGASLLQSTVHKHASPKVDTLLQADCRFGLVEDQSGNTALTLALKNARKPIVRKLLHKILDEQLTSPCLHAFMRHREEIATIYPDLFLEFLQGIVLVREKKLAPEGQNIARLRSATSWVCKGSQVLGHSVVVNGRTYWGDEDLWSHLLGHSVTVASDESGTSDRDQSFTSYFLADDPSTRIGRKSKRVEVAALRVPLEGVVSHTAGRIDSPKTTLLYLILQASAEQEDYSVFGTVLVRSILEFKWRKYGRNIFMMRLSIHLVLLFFVAVAAVGLPRSVCTPGEGGATDTCTATWREMCGSGWGVATLVSLCFSLLGCVVSLALRVRQALLLTQEVIYLGSLVEYLNTISYLCWSFVGVAFLLRDPIMLPLSAWSSMMFTFRVLAFARGFRSVGPLVRMIEKIIVKIQKFLLVMFLLIAGFALFFIALGAPPVQSLLWVLNTGVFGQDPYPGGGAKFDPLSRVSLTHTVLLFELLMMLVALVLLNLLIAIMSSVYESVERVAEFEADYEKGLSILDIERLTLPVIVNWFGLDIDELFPKWLHLLMPAGMIEDRQTVEQKPVVGRAA